MFAKTDMFLLLKVFIPISRYIDKRFHMNPWRLASNILGFSVLLLAVDWTRGAVRNPSWLDSVLLLMFFGIAWVRWDDMKRLNAMSAAYERSPDKTPTDWLRYLIPYNRMLHTSFGVVFFVLDIAALFTGGFKGHELDLIGRCWFLVVGIGFYFAACPRPPGKRKEKKAKAPMFGILSPVKT